MLYRYVCTWNCSYCDQLRPIAPWGEDPMCFECRGYTLLDCGKHVQPTTAISGGGEFMPVTTCAECSDDVVQ